MTLSFICLSLLGDSLDSFDATSRQNLGKIDRLDALDSTQLNILKKVNELSKISKDYVKKEDLSEVKKKFDQILGKLELIENTVAMSQKKSKNKDHRQDLDKEIGSLKDTIEDIKKELVDLRAEVKAQGFLIEKK